MATGNRDQVQIVLLGGFHSVTHIDSLCLISFKAPSQDLELKVGAAIKSVTTIEQMLSKKVKTPQEWAAALEVFTKFQLVMTDSFPFICSRGLLRLTRQPGHKCGSWPLKEISLLLAVTNLMLKSSLKP